ncbi:IS66 family transposase [Vibrio kyushuensis]|uniref:IS66 family transposase n=1 Tax=Vibrio kyushuensis TaxID=2910249 RepID=UPI003D10ABA9
MRKTTYINPTFTTEGDPKSKLGEAINYIINHWPTLVRIIYDDRLRSMDNNRVERAVGPLLSKVLDYR